MLLYLLFQVEILLLYKKEVAFSWEQLQIGEGFKRVAKVERGSKELTRSEGWNLYLAFSIIFPITWFSIELNSVRFKQVRQIFMCLAEKGQFAEWCFIESMFCYLQWKSNHSQLQMTILCLLCLFIYFQRSCICILNISRLPFIILFQGWLIFTILNYVSF